jgi:glycosyltransferase involved in cell wall biosynthesis
MECGDGSLMNYIMPAAPPKISIVTPSFNQGKFLEETLLSVIGQNYPNLEYIVMDGGSTDSSADIIRKYQDKLTYWVSSPDQGQYDAINRGFARSTGEIMAWLNSDDKFTPWAFQVVSEIFSEHPEIEWLTTAYPLHWDAQGRAVSCGYNGGFGREGFFRGEHLPGCGWHSRCYVQQESTFWRRSLWERAGARLDTSFSLAGDFELWARFYKHAELYAVETPLGGFRSHSAQKTANHMEKYLEQARRAFFLHGGKPPSKAGKFIYSRVAKLINFLQRRYDRRVPTLPATKLCAYRLQEGGWKIKKT